MLKILLYVRGNDLGEKNLQPTQCVIYNDCMAAVKMSNLFLGKKMSGLPSMSGQYVPLSLYRHSAHIYHLNYIQLKTKYSSLITYKISFIRLYLLL